ncbi:DUF5009 domain-containing protein [Chitinimonas sp. BJYL2]|uniref:DUF5009 domain-containing protein n=1 Tax=Chitinimonas sp. BJYL2 TaxID=2976696 RepID=UPI0022B2E98C|nr:DUF5009 domain-containing protein [Chitinimonas sp. BJYL2]
MTAAPRNDALDLLRGLAIVGMVLSGLLPHDGSLPGWMYHAQVGPPDFKFHPDVPGISWVDLVFPFFLFCLGAALPLAFETRWDQHSHADRLLGLLKRGGLLALLALAIHRYGPLHLSAAPSKLQWASGIAAFAGIGLLLAGWPGTKRGRWWAGLLGACLLGALAWWHQGSKAFDPARNDIILMVLANMAVFGGLVWLLTRGNIPLRLGVIAMFAALRLTQGVEGSWNHKLWRLGDGLQWLYRPDFLKYLCIVIPGSIVGDLLLTAARSPSSAPRRTWLGWLALALILVNLYGLYTRQIGLNLLLTLALGMALWWQARRGSLLHRQLAGWALYWIALGLCFEALDGGIKKDPSSWSYWFLSSGLAICAWLALDAAQARLAPTALWRALRDCGQNPLLAYVLAGFVLLPLLALSGLGGVLATYPALGLLKPLLLTALVILLTALATRRGWLWKT